jgi:tetratricopeptide (TPR) repeat protein
MVTTHIRTPLSPLWIVILSAASAVQAADTRDAYDRGNEYLRCERFGEAVKCFEQVLRADPHEKRAGRCLGFARLLSGDARTAICDFTNAIRVNRADAALYFGRGYARQMLGANKESLADMEEALRLDPGYTQAAWGRLEVLADLRDPRVIEAINTFQSLTERDSAVRGPYADFGSRPRVTLTEFPSLVWWRLIYDRYRLAGRPSTTDTPAHGDVEGQLKLALAFATHRRLDEAIACLDKAVTLAPDDIDLRKVRGALHAIKREYKAAWEDLQRTLEVTRPSGDTKPGGKSRGKPGDTKPGGKSRGKSADTTRSC